MYMVLDVISESTFLEKNKVEMVTAVVDRVGWAIVTRGSTG